MAQDKNPFAAAQTSISEPTSPAIISGFTPTQQTVDPTAVAIKGLGGIAAVAGKVSDDIKTSELSKGMSDIDVALQSDVVSYQTSKQELAGVVDQQLGDKDLTDQDRDTLGSLHKNFEKATAARRNKLIRSGDLDTRLSTKVKAFISDNPHLASEARSLLAGYKGTGSLPPEIKGVLKGRESVAKEMTQIGLNPDDPVQTANYLAKKRADFDARSAALQATTAIGNAKYVSEDVINVAMESVNKQFDSLLAGWKLRSPENKDTMLAELDAFQANIMVGVNANMSSREDRARAKGEFLRFDAAEGDRVRKSVSGYIDIYRSIIKNHGDQPFNAAERMTALLKNKAQLAAPQITSLRAVYGDEGVNRVLTKWDTVYGMTNSQYIEYLDNLPPTQRASVNLLRSMSPDTAIANIIQGIGTGVGSADLSSLYGRGMVNHVSKRNLSFTTDMYKAGQLDDKTRSLATNSLQVLLNSGDSIADTRTWDQLLNAKPAEKQMLLNDPKINKELKNEFASFRRRSLTDAARSLEKIGNIRINTKTGRLELIQSKWPSGPGKKEAFPYSSVFQLDNDAETVRLLNDYVALGDHPDFDKVADVPSLHLAADALIELQKANKLSEKPKEEVKE